MNHIHHVKWTYLSVFISGALQLSMLSVISRLIEPSDFGVIATALLLIRAGQTLVQSGYERAIVWADELDEDTSGSYQAVAVGTGLILWLLFSLTSYPISLFFHDERVISILPIMASMLVLSSIGLVGRGILRKSLRFKELALGETASYIIGFIFVGLPLATLKFGLWALVWANLTQALAQGLIPLIMTKVYWFKRFEFAKIKRGLSFSYSVSALGLVEFIDSQVTSLFIGHFFGMRSLGIFNRSYALIQLPLEQFGTSLTRVLFTNFSANKDDPQSLAKSTFSFLKALSLLIIPLALGGAAASKFIVAFILGPNWGEAAPIFSALSIGTCAAVIGNLLATLNEAANKIKYKAIAQLSITSLLVLFLILTNGRGSLRLSVLVVQKCYFFLRNCIFRLEF